MSDAIPTTSPILDTEILIIGGGLAGLPLAIALGGAGIPTVIIDREAPARMLAAPFDGRTTAVALGSRQVLNGLGLWPGIAADAEPILDIRVADQGSPLFLHYDHRDVGDQPFGFIVENRVLRRAMLERVADLPSLTHLAPAALRAVERTESGVEAVLEDGRRIRARLCVAADGRDSAVRRTAGIGTVGWGYRQHAIACTVAHERAHHGVAVEHFLPGGPFAILPMSGNRSSIVWSESSALAPYFMALSPADFATEVARRFGPHLGATDIIGPRWSYPLQVMVARSMIGTRLALLGEAAHVIHPIAGQGLNLGIRDVAALAELLVDACRLGLDPGAPDLLARYQRWRRVDTVALAAVTDGLNRLFSNNIGPVKLARGLGLAVVNQAPPLKRLLMRHAMGVLGTLPRLVRGEAL
jgi:2-octaprenyl-6-methoxyphenol hydroxylase